MRHHHETFVGLRPNHEAPPWALTKRGHEITSWPWGTTMNPSWNYILTMRHHHEISPSVKYLERNFLLKASQVTDFCLSSIMDFMLIHQCSASPVSMYTKKANLFSFGHIFASNILSISFKHWSTTSGLVLSLSFTGWCFKKSFKLHSRGGGHGSGRK